MDRLLNVDRAALESSVTDLFGSKRPARPQARALAFESVELVKVNLSAISPVPEAMSAFREVSSSQEDKAHIITNADIINLAKSLGHDYIMANRSFVLLTLFF